MSDEGRPRAGSLLDKFDGLFRRSRSKSTVGAEHVAHPPTEQSALSMQLSEELSDSTAGAAHDTPNDASSVVETTTPTRIVKDTSNDELAHPPQHASDVTSPDPKPTPTAAHKLPIAAAPPLLVEASLDATSSSSRMGKEALKMSFADALAQLARKHGVYYTEGSIHSKRNGSGDADSRAASQQHQHASPSTAANKSIIHEEIVWWMYDSTQQPTAGRWHHRHHHTNKPHAGERASLPSSTTAAAAHSGPEWAGVEPPNSLLLLASMSHRPPTTKAMLQADDLKILDHVQWPVLSVVAELAQSHWKGVIQRNIEDPRTWLPSSEDHTRDAVAQQTADDSRRREHTPSPPNVADASDLAAHHATTGTNAPHEVASVVDSAAASAERHATHLRHRLLDFFKRYDPQRMPPAHVVSDVVSCGIPEQLLFEFLRGRYGLSLSAPQMFLSAAGGGRAHHERALSHHHHALPHEDELRSPQSTVGNGSPFHNAAASPDFCLVPEAGPHHPPQQDDSSPTIMHSESMTTHPPHGGSLAPSATYPVNTDAWPAAWAEAVGPLAPITTTAEVVLDGATWNSQASKPGLANPRTSFAVASMPTQLFTFGGVTMELLHEAMEASILSRRGVVTDRFDEDIGGLVMYPKSQAAALRAHRQALADHHADAIASSGDMLDALDATLRSSAKVQGDVSPSQHAAPAGRPRRRRAAADDGNGAADLLGDRLACAMLDSTLSWRKNFRRSSNSPSTAASKVSHRSRRQVVLQHPVTLPLPSRQAGDHATIGDESQGSKELVLYLEDHWDIDDLDLRPVQSPLSFV